MADLSSLKPDGPSGPEYNLKDATARNAIQSSKTLKSSVVTVTDAAPINAEDITVDITPVQDLHGYDRPWAGGAGKNISKPYTYTDTNSGMTFAYDGTCSCVLNGTSNGDVGRPLISEAISNGYTFTLMAGTYTTSVSDANVIVQVYDENSNSISDSRENPTFTLAQTTVVFVRLFVTLGKMFSNKTVRYQLESGSTATSYEPYSNICPIEGHTEAKVETVGNVFSYPSNIDNNIRYLGINVGDGDFTLETTAPKVGEASYLFLLSGNVSSGADNILNNVCSGYSRTVASSNGYVTVAYRNIANATPLTAYTTYLYKEGAKHTYTASFGETVYGGKWHVTAGGTDKTMAEAILSSLSFSRLYVPSVNKTYFYASISNGAKTRGNEGLDGGLCSCFELVSSYWQNLDNGQITVGSSFISADVCAVVVREDSIITVEDFMAAVSGQQLTYELATPTTISTPKQNVPMLQGINTVSADCGDTSLKYQPDNVIGELKGEIEDSIIYEDFKWTTESSQSYSAGTPGTYGTSSSRSVAKEGYDVIGVTFVENRLLGDCILTLNYIPSTSRVEVIVFRATSSAVTIADEDIAYRVAYKKA